jgi:Tol biopolymer transport system component
LASLGALAALAFAASASATYRGHNGLIAFSAAASDGSNQIYTVQPNGHGLRQITSLGGDALNADWSPDGEKIVFELDTDAGGSVEVMNADGSHIRNVTSSVACCSGQPSFTPDGKQIVFERYNPDTNDDAIWIMNADGSNPHRIIDPWPDGAGGVTDPNVSPDGTTVSFVGSDNSLFGGPPNFDPANGLFTASLDGSNFTQLQPFSSDQAIKQDWAPDGKHLLIGENANLFNQGDSANIATIRPDGQGLQFLTNFHDGTTRAFAGSYSPDGNWIVFRLEQNGSYALERMKPDGTDVHTILPFSSFKPRFIDWGSSEPEGGR